ncbi:hypothetical protein [Bacillus sp. FJAT-27445]|uniref:hypothetical protein n=1 Tax=Bacillus sp. FJAT-27445 TaxID=1679166 RepID=UPI000744368D|nr:hypothetical protein [Bacillus sp. FJAT-27445]
MKITNLSKIELVRIEIRPDKKNFIVEALEAREFYEMPEPAVEAIRLIEQKMPLNEIEEKLRYHYPKEDIDILDFANQLIELGLVSKVDGEEVHTQIDKKEDLGFTWIPAWVGKMLFNRGSYILFGFIFLINILYFIVKPDLFPNYKDYFVFSWMSLNILLWIAIGMTLLIIHEFGHILAMRSNNLPTRLSIGHRLMFLALETDMEGAWKLPAGKRNVLYLGGLCFDMTILGIALSVQYFYPTAPALLLATMKIVVIDIFIRFIFQCGVYMKTDFYFVLESSTGSYNLMENAHHYIKSFFKKEARKAGETAYEEEKRTIKWYSVIYFLGVILTIMVFAFYSVPQIIMTMSRSIERLGSPIFSKSFFDGAIVSIQTVIGLSLLLYSWNKKYRLKKE